MDPEYLHQVRDLFQPGDPEPRLFEVGASETEVTIDLENLDRTFLVSVRRYHKPASGRMPEGITTMAGAVYWHIESAPVQARYSSRVSVQYGDIPGIEEPADLRLLYRRFAGDPWEILDTELDIGGQSLGVAEHSQLTGQYTLGSVSPLNPLTADPPGMVRQPNPPTGNLSTPERPLLSWQPAEYASRYDLFLWKADQVEPETATKSGIGSSSFQVLSDLKENQQYNWRIVARNLNGRTAGPVWSFTVGPSPDLVVSEIQAPPTAVGGNPIEIGWTVTNQGALGTRSPQWSDRAFLSKDSVLNLASDIYLGEVENPSYLGAEDEYRQTGRFEIPVNIRRQNTDYAVEGAHYVIVETDFRNRENETNDGNNITVTGDPVEISVPSLPDLQVTDLTEIIPYCASLICGPSGCTVIYRPCGEGIPPVGESFGLYDLRYVIRWQGRNQGASMAEHWSDGLFFQEDSTFDPGQAIPLTVQVKTDLEPGEEYELANSPIRLIDLGKQAFASGRSLPDSGYFFVVSDLQSSVYEGTDEENNIYRYPEQLVLRSVPPSDLEAIDLQTVSSAESGDSITVRWNIRNNGPARVAPGYWYDGFYLSSGQEFDPMTAQELGRIPHSNNLEDLLVADGQIDLEEKLRLPDGISGDYYLHLIVDDDNQVNEVVDGDPNQANNMRTIGPLSISLADYPDLHVTGLEYPDQLTAGSSFLLRYTIDNIGPGPANPSWTDRFFLSSGELLDEDAYYLQQNVHQEIIQGGAESVIDVSLTLPKSLSRGDYYLHIVTDADSVIYEHQGEGNNRGRSGPISVTPYPRPDLTVETMNIPSSAVSGSPVETGWVVINQGPVKTQARSWTDALYLSTDQQYDEEDLLLHEETITRPLQAGESYEVHTSVKLPPDFSGDRYVLIRIDPTRQIKEVITNNNLRTTDEPTVISLGASADLAVQSVDYSGEPTAGQPLTMNVSIVNQGEAIPAGKRWTDSWKFSSTTSALDQTSPLLSREVHGPLGTGEEYVQKIGLPLPIYASGKYYISTSTNSAGQIGEGGQSGNNTHSDIISITQPPPVDLVVRNVQGPTEARPGEVVTITYDLVNQGENAAEGLLVDGLYFSEDVRFDADDQRMDTRQREISLAPQQSSEMQFTFRIPDPKIPASATSSAPSAVTSSDTLGESIPGVIPGEYYFLIRTDLRNNIRETDNANNTTASAERIDVSITNLALAGSLQSSVVADGQTYFQVETESGKDLKVSLSNLSPGVRPATFGIYVAFDRTPTPDDFDVAYHAESGGTPEVFVPETQAGTYYILIENAFLDTEKVASFSIRADAFDFALFGITPESGGNSGRVVATVTGAQLDKASPLLVKGDDVIEGEVVTVRHSMEIDVRFDLQGMSLGDYDLVAQGENGEQVRLEGAFEVATPVTNQLRYTITAPGLIANEPADMDVIVRNENNIDHDIVVMTLILSDASGFRLKTEDFFGIPVALQPSDTTTLPEAGMAIGMDLPEAGLFYEDGWAILTAFAKDVRVGEELRARLQIDKIVGEIGEPYPMMLSVDGMSYSEFTGLTQLGIQEMQRQLHGSDPDGLSVGQAETVRKLQKMLGSNDFSGMAERYSREIGLIGDGPVLARTLPLEYDPEGIKAHTGFMKAVSTETSNAEACHASFCYPLVVFGAGGVIANWYIFFTLGAVFFGLVAFGPVGFLIMTLYTVNWLLLVDIYDRTGSCLPAKLFCPPIEGSADPNDIVGPGGAGDARWVRYDEILPYKIRFENDPQVANTPAREVNITQPLDTDLDLRSFRLEGFGFGEYDFEVPDGRAFYSTRLDMRDSLGVFVDFEAGLDLEAGRAFFRFRSIDPATGELSAVPQKGFLPPNLTPPEGDGYVQYRIKPDSSVETGDRIDAEAAIIFDRNPAIMTPKIFNTIDADLPTSLLTTTVQELDSTGFLLSWSGNDPVPGSGTRGYTLYMSRNDSAFQPLERDIRDSVYVFEGEPNTRYGFFILAEDHAGNIEPMKKSSELDIVLGVGEPGSGALPGQFALYQNYPNPFNPATTIRFDLPETGNVDLRTYNIRGQQVRRMQLGVMEQGTYDIQVNMGGLASGIYFYRLNISGLTGNPLYSDIRKCILLK